MFKKLTHKLSILFGAKAEAPVPPRPAAPTVDDSAQELAPYKQENGTYVFNLTVAPADDGALKIYSSDLSGFCNTHRFPKDFSEGQKLVSVQHGLDGARFGLDFNYDLKGVFYVRHKDSDIYIHQDCETSGLKISDQYELVFVPEGINWQPAKHVKEEAPKQSCPVLRPRF